MGLLRRRGGGGGVKYRMREKVFAIGDDFWIENEAGERAFKVDGKALRIRDTLVIEDASGADLFSIPEKKLHIHNTMEVERDGQTVASIERGGDTLAEVSKRWFRVRDTYGIEIEPGQDDALLLAVTVCIDQMSRGG